MPYQKRDLFERLSKKYITNENGCWIWTGGAQKGKYKYGYIWLNGKNSYAHRLSYSLYKGEIPEGMYVCHTCDVPSCVNPSHLFLGTPSDNTRDCMSKNRFKPRPPIGSKHPKSKFVESDIPVIVEMGKSGMSARAISRFYGVNQSTIRNILLGLSWSHVAR